MILCDVNVFLHAFREDSPHHKHVKAWLESELNSRRACGVSSLVLSAFIRIVTHPRVYDPPTPLADALAFVDALRAVPTVVAIEPGPEHWSIFEDLLRRSDARGNLVADAWLAAIAIESGCEWITMDRDFARFPGLRWRNPLE